jgi:hypothetical protein
VTSSTSHASSCASAPESPARETDLALHLARWHGDRLPHRGHGPPLVLVHGTSADHTRWARVIDALSAKFAMYVLDHRGRGVPTSRRDYPSPKDPSKGARGATRDVTTGARLHLLSPSLPAKWSRRSFPRISLTPSTDVPPPLLRGRTCAPAPSAPWWPTIATGSRSRPCRTVRRKEAWRRRTRPHALLEQDRAVDIAHLIHASDEVSEAPTALECERFQVGHQCVTGDGIEDQLICSRMASAFGVPSA